MSNLMIKASLILAIVSIVTSNISLYVAVSNIQQPVKTPIIMDADLWYGLGVRVPPGINGSFGNFSFIVKVTNINVEESVVSGYVYMEQAGLCQNKTFTLRLNDIFACSFRGYTIQLWLKNIKPPRAEDGREAIALINTYILRIPTLNDDEK